MAVSKRDVLALLDPEEPDYSAVTTLGAGALPHLRALVGGDDPMLASKAAYAASVLEGDIGKDVVAAAGQHDDPVVRVAAAAAAANLPAAAASSVLLDLVGDPDPGVRKVARSTAPAKPSGDLAERMAQAPDAEDESDPDSTLADGEDLSSLGRLMPGEQPSTEMPGSSGGLMPGEAGGDRM
jgi:HEAT repeat protein